MTYSGGVRRVVLIFLALTVIVPSVATGATLYRCGHDGALRDHCCCNPKTHEPPVRTSVRAGCCGALRDHCCCTRKPEKADTHRLAVRAGCCCETVHVAAADAPARSAAVHATPALAPIVAIVVRRPSSVVRTEMASPRSQPTGPPRSLHEVLLL